jgi:pyrimidine-nucleoside phosphorylase
MHVPTLIEKKRDGARLSTDEIRHIVRAFADDALPDYQMSALAMAIYFRGMDDRETADLTGAMLESGESLSWNANHPPVVDKHSTGGVGDKVSLLLAPLLACDGLWVPMISGRGLGTTGGTLDKLESIPNFRVSLSPDELRAQVERLGVAMVGQTPRLCPADKKLYALRDVTATVPSRPLIVASIMSKKLSEGLDRLVLDVKFGGGAFMRTREDAEALAQSMVSVGTSMGVKTSARLTPMDEPLGRSVGNALEVAECLEVFQGSGPPDLIELTLDLAEIVAASSRDRLREWLCHGMAWRKFQELCEAQGGDLDAFSRRDPAPVIANLRADRSGVLARVDAGTIGRAAVGLGAGRHNASDSIDHRVGFDQIAKTGTRIATGDTLLRVHAATATAAESALAQVRAAIEIFN